MEDVTKQTSDERNSLKSTIEIHWYDRVGYLNATENSIVLASLRSVSNRQ